MVTGVVVCDDGAVLMWVFSLGVSEEEPSGVEGPELISTLSGVVVVVVDVLTGLDTECKW